MKPLRVGLLAVLAVAALAIAGPASASAANFIATGHDMDYHCGYNTTSECEYFKIVVNQARGSSTLPILAIDNGSEVKNALLNAGYAESEIQVVNPNEEPAFKEAAFVDSASNPKYSVIIVASDETCGGCDLNEESETNINARSADFATYFNHGGGIVALAGADRYETYYNFVPLKVGATAVSEPFTVQPFGESLGVTTEMANCCATHNSFAISPTAPPEPFKVLESDSAENSETIEVTGVIGEKGFEKEKPAPAPAPAPTPVVTVLPSKTEAAPKKCMSARVVTVHWTSQKSGALSKVTLSLNGKVYKRLPGSARSAKISFAGRSKGAVTLKIDGQAKKGGHFLSVRTFHPCAAKIESNNPVTLYLRHH